MKALVVSGGNEINKDKLISLCEQNDVIIAADAGVEQLLKINKLPDYLVGDLDSISKKSIVYLKSQKVKTIVYPKEKDKSDTEIAIDLILPQNPDNITLVSATGTRIDHSLANIFLLKKLSDLNIDTQIIDNNNIIKLIKPEQIVSKDETFKYISIIPMCLDGIVITLNGFHYNLTKKHIEFGSSFGISNEIEENVGYIIKHSGEGLLILSKD
ncbi:thiamine diphosphokinase [Soehngenia saccharolytica]|nr:thiamine diphosphokinase [Soehngenia saccharolytica]